MESMTEKMLAGQYGSITNDGNLQKLIENLRWALPQMFVFLKYSGVNQPITPQRELCATSRSSAK